MIVDTSHRTTEVTTPTAGQEDTIGAEPEIDEWANLAGDARRPGEEGGPAQCALAAARNASRDKNLTVHVRNSCNGAKTETC